MFRLIKLAIYTLLGYAIYEFIRGLAQGEDMVQTERGASGSRELNEALEGSAGRTNMSGPGRGQRVRTEEASGESVPHRVGRGVVQ